MFRRILVPVDGSPEALLAAGVAARLASVTGGRLRACSVIDGALVAATPVSHRAQLRAELRRESAASLGEVRALCRRLRVPSSGVIVEGDVAHGILEAARGFRADLIALSTRGPGRVRVLLGRSVAADVVRRASCPVLLVRRDSLPTRGRRRDRRGVS